MNHKNIKIVIILFILFLLDLIKPFGYSLNIEFLFLGIIFLCLNYPLYLSLVLSIIFGYLKDSFTFSAIPISVIEFPLIALVIHYALVYFAPIAKPVHKTLLRFIIFFSIAIMHIILNSLIINNLSLMFSFMFLIRCSLIFIALSYLSRKWLNISPIEYI